MTSLKQCSSCKHFKRTENYCNIYSVNTFSDSTACSKYTPNPDNKIYAPIISDKEAMEVTPTDKLNDAKDSEVVSNTEKDTRPYVHPNLFSFRGRIRRLEYWLTCFVYFFWIKVIPIYILSIYNYNYDAMCILYLLSLIPVYWILIASGCKRCHDCNFSGWWQLVPLFFMCMFFGDGDSYTNNYGPDPKGR